MRKEMYSVEEVAERLGLHVRTVRGYIRDGRLAAVRIGKQYRIAAADLDALTGRAAPPPSGPVTAEVSSIVSLDGVDRAAADRLGTFVHAAANTPPPAAAARPLRVQTIYDEDRHRLRIVIIGEAVDTAELLRMLDAVIQPGTGLVIGEEADDG